MKIIGRNRECSELKRYYESDLPEFLAVYGRRRIGKRPKNPKFWTSNIENSSLITWKGYAFEQVCLSHVEQIKQALGIAAIGTEVSSWRSSASAPGAQIDLLIDRKDGIINLCEMKYSKAEFAISGKDETAIRNKIAVFETESRTKKSSSFYNGNNIRNFKR